MSMNEVTMTRGRTAIKGYGRTGVFRSRNRNLAKNVSRRSDQIDTVSVGTRLQELDQIMSSPISL